VRIPTRILVVDDDPAIAEVFSELLRGEGYEVWSAENGQQGLKLTEERHPDVVILDIVLPDISGIEICRQIKSDPALADTFVVLLSGVATGPAATVRGLDTGADDYITKPVHPLEFTARIRTIVRLRDTTAALRQREQHYRGLVEILPDALILIDRQANIVSVNPQLLSMLEYRTETELAGVSILQLARPEDRERMQTEVGLTFETGVMRNAEYTLCKSNGSLVPVALSAAVTRDAQGNLSGMLALLRDNTDRKLSERLLRERAEFNRRIISTALDGFWMVDLHGRLLDVNDAYCTMSGYTLPELLAMKIWNLSANESTPEAVAEHIARIVKVGSDRFETRHRRKDGRIIDVGVSTTYLHFGGGYLFAFLRDITERKQAQQRLADALDLNESIMAASSIGILAYKATGQCVFANEAASRILKSEIQDTPDFRTFKPWSRCGLSKMAEETLRSQMVQTGEVHYTSPSGEEIWLDCHVDSFVSAGEQHVLVMVSNATQRKQSEEELKRLPGRILEAQEAERLRVSRDLHDGVNQILASAKMRLHGVLEAGATTMRPSAREILARCEKMLVQALEENRLIAHDLRPSDLDELGFEVACRNFCRAFGARTALTVKCRIPRIEPRLPGAVELNLFRILQEALNNVNKHAQAKTVRVELVMRKDSVVLRVRDDGRGISQRNGNKARGLRKGQGLGLLGMKERVALLAGDLVVDSAPKRGTTLTVTIPRNSVK
jgi:PAS domain S-box-containing protein